MTKKVFPIDKYDIMQERCILDIASDIYPLNTIEFIYFAVENCHERLSRLDCIGTPCIGDLGTLTQFKRVASSSQPHPFGNEARLTNGPVRAK